MRKVRAEMKQIVSQLQCGPIDTSGYVFILSVSSFILLSRVGVKQVFLIITDVTTRSDRMGAESAASISQNFSLACLKKFLNPFCFACTLGLLPLYKAK